MITAVVPLGDLDEGLDLQPGDVAHGGDLHRHRGVVQQGYLGAAGDVCGSIEEKDGCNYKMGFDAAMTFGYIMADSINTDMSA